MLCPRCGKETSDTAQFCEHCKSNIGGISGFFKSSLPGQPSAAASESQSQTNHEAEQKPQRMRSKRDVELDFAREEMGHSCRTMHLWRGALCGVLGILWLTDTISFGFENYWFGHSASLMDVFNNGFVAISALICNFLVALITLSVIEKDYSAYEPSFLYGLTFSLADLFNFIGLWSLIGGDIVGNDLNLGYLIYRGEFPYAPGGDSLSVFGVCYVLLVITCFILSIPYSQKSRKLKKICGF